MNKLGELYLKKKQEQDKIDESTSSSEFSSDMDRDEEQDDVEEFLSKAKAPVQGKAKSSKKISTKLEMIPEASLRFEDTLNKPSTVSAKNIGEVKKRKEKTKKKVKRFRIVKKDIKKPSHAKVSFQEDTRN